jgi:hypothetical protein
MNIVSFTALLALVVYPACADTTSRRATITGSGGPARCLIEVNVDGTAQIEVRGDSANLTTLSGQSAYWRRFECNTPVPQGPVDFRLGRISGRGNVRLLEAPRSNRGVALIHLSDPQSGRGMYGLELIWQAPGGWRPPSPSPPWPGRGGSSAFPLDRTIRACQDSVTSRLSQDGFAYVTFESTIPHNNPGRSDWITGSATARRGPAVQRFSFSCSADFVTGAIRSVDVRRW